MHSIDHNLPANKYTHIGFPGPHPGIHGGPYECQKNESGVLRLLEHALPVHALTWGLDKGMKIIIRLDEPAK